MSEFMEAVVGVFTTIFGLSVFGYSVWGFLFRLLGIIIGLIVIAAIVLGLYRLFIYAVQSVNPEAARSINLYVGDAVYSLLFDSLFGRAVVDLLSGIADAAAAVLRAVALIITVSVNRTLSVLLIPVEWLNNRLEPLSRRSEKDRLEKEKSRLSNKRENQQVELETLKLRLEVQSMRGELRKVRRGEATPDQISSQAQSTGDKEKK